MVLYLFVETCKHLCRLPRFAAVANAEGKTLPLLIGLLLGEVEIAS